MEIMNIDKLNDIYNSIINNISISEENKIKLLLSLENYIKKYYCYKKGKTSCPYSYIKKVEEYDNDNKETIIMCNYFNIGVSSYNDVDIEYILDCPIKSLKKKINYRIKNKEM